MKKQIYVVYDSGVGGLTVLTEIIKQNIKANFVYIGDTKNAPYGNKTPSQIIRFVKENLIDLQENYLIKGLIMACNTASILAKKAIEEFFHIKVYSISESILEDVKDQEGICFLTTKAAEKSLFFQEQQENSTVIGCEKFVPLIESKRFLFEEYRKDIVEESLAELNQKECQKIVLACTHFPSLKKEITEYTNGKITVYDPSESFVIKLKEEIVETYFSLEFIVTGYRDEFEGFIQERIHWAPSATDSEDRRIV